jgi:hypothetical protein
MPKTRKQRGGLKPENYRRILNSYRNSLNSETYKHFLNFIHRNMYNYNKIMTTTFRNLKERVNVTRKRKQLNEYATPMTIKFVTLLKNGESLENAFLQSYDMELPEGYKQELLNLLQEHIENDESKISENVTYNAIQKKVMQHNFGEMELDDMAAMFYTFVRTVPENAALAVNISRKGNKSRKGRRTSRK